MCEEKSNGGTTTTRHTLVDWLLRVPLWHGGGCAAVGWFGRRRRHRCVRVWFFLSGLLKISVRFGEPEWNYCKIHSTQHENFEASLSPPVPPPAAAAALGIRLHKYTPPFAISSRHLRQSRSVVVFMGQEFHGSDRVKTRVRAFEAHFEGLK